MSRCVYRLAGTITLLGLMFWQGPATANEPRAADEPQIKMLSGRLQWVTISHGARSLRALIGFPDTSASVMSIVLVHDDRGLTPWMGQAANRLAQAGYLVIAPDLLSDASVDTAGSGQFTDLEHLRRVLFQLSSERILTDLSATADFVSSLPAADGRVAVAGFGWGGERAFLFATHQRGLEATFVFYGAAPPEEALYARIQAPIYGFYGGYDGRVNATLEATAAMMRRAGKDFEAHVTPGVGSGFLRFADDDAASFTQRRAAFEAWDRWLHLLAATVAEPEPTEE